MRHPLSTMLTNAVKTLAAAALVLGFIAAAGPASADGFDDDFQGYSDLKQVLEKYGVGKFAGRGKASGSAALDPQGGLTLTASTTQGGNELPAFTLVTLLRKGSVVRLGAEPDVEVQAVFKSLDSAPFGEKPVSPVTLGLAAQGGGPSLTGQVGMIGRPNAKQVTVIAAIEISAGDGRKTLVEKTMQNADNLAGRTISLKVKGDKVDLLVDGESVVGGAVPLGVDLASNSIATDPLTPSIQVRKNFGKQPRSATLARFAMKDQTDQQAVAAMLPTIAITLSPAPQSGDVLQSKLDEPRALSPFFIGYNGNLTNFDKPWDNADLVKGTRELRAATVRYPAGSIGNVWDWDRGWAFEDIDYEKTIKWVANIKNLDKRYTLENLAEGAKAADFSPVFVMNMIHHTLDQQVGHLKRVEAEGVPIKLIELGNEYYFGRGADAYMNDRFPTAEDYAKEANRWAARFKKEFPGVRVAATGSSGGDGNTSERRQTWNDKAVPILDDSVDAITIHKYAGHGLDGLLEGNDMEAALSKFPNRIAPPEVQKSISQRLQTDEGLAYAMSQPAAAWREMHERTLVPDMPIWLTEFNIDDQIGSVRNTWAHTLFVLAYLDVFLTDKRVELVHLHNLYGGDLYPALWSEDGLPEKVQTVGKRPKINEFDITAAGLAMQVLAQAMEGSGNARRVAFENAPGVTVDPDNGSDPVTDALTYGWLFEQGMLVVNSSSHALTLTLPGDASAAQHAEVLSAKPTDIVAGRRSISVNSAKIGTGHTLELPAHAVAVLTW